MTVEKKQLNTPVDAKLLEDFKIVCSEYGFKMNVVIEAFMNEFINGDFDIIVSRKGLQLKQNK